MLRERPALEGKGDFEVMNVRPQTKRALTALAKHLHWNLYEVVHALVTAELEARKEPEP